MAKLATAIAVSLLAVSSVVAQPQASVRVGHAVPGAPSVDVYADDRLFLSDLRFGQLSPPRPVPAGRTLQLRITPHDQNTTVAAFPAAFNAPSLAFASGLPSKIAPFVTPAASGRPTPGKAQLRFIHLSPDAPAVDVALKNGATLFSNIAFQQAATFIEVPIGTYDVVVRPHGTTTDVLGATVRLDGEAFSVVAEGLVGDKTLEAVLFREFE